MSKQEQIIKMFDDIAPSYDRANRVLSFGIDSSWRRFGVEQIKSHLAAQSAAKDLIIYDIACGSGDMCALLCEIENSQVFGIDPSSQMLKIARERFLGRKNVTFKQASATQIPATDASVDVLTISYGFRNVVEKQAALKEFHRVLRPGGLLCVLEFCRREKGGFIGSCRDFYLAKILPSLGALISKNRAAYEYLPASIDEFYSPQEFRAALADAGFSELNCKAFSFGVSHMFLSCKI